MTVHVLAPGPQTTVQDGGRHGVRHLGVGQAGALDGWSLAVANLLVGNAPGAPVLESVLAGPTLRFGQAARIALCGAATRSRSAGVAIPGWRPVDLPAGSELHVGPCLDGARVTLAIAGGWAVPQVLGSASTDLRGGFGGHGGRALAAGDQLPVGDARQPPAARVRVAPWWIDATADLDLATPAILRVLAGRDATTPADALCAQPWRVAPASNRQGVRLEAKPLQVAGPARDGSRPSEPVAPGTVQLPGDGQPIVLLGDAQSHGGYPRIAHVIAADLPRMAQLRPGDTVRFTPCTHAEAQRLRRAQAARLARIAIAIAGKAGDWQDEDVIP